MMEQDDRQSPAESLFLRNLFSELRKAGVAYAVMRNHETLPDSAGDSDVDLIIPLSEGERAKTAILESIACSDGVAIGIGETLGFFKVYALGKAACHPYPWWGVCIDVNVGLFFKGNGLLAEGRVLPIQDHRGIAVLRDDFAGVLGVLKEVLNNGVFPSRYSIAARCAAETSWQDIELLLAPMGKPALELLNRMLLVNAAPEELRADCLRFRALVMARALSAQPVRCWWRRIVFEWSKIRRYINPPGMVVAVLGVDGAGKSTVINAILPALSAATHNAVIVQHLRPGLLPPLARWRGGHRGQPGPVLEPHSSRPSGTLGSLFRLTYLMLDYVFGYWFWTRPKIAKQPTVVIFDRYAYDMANDQRRFRISLPNCVAGWFVALAPRPDLIICLHGTPEAIAARKSELPLEETRRQVDALRSFAAREPNAVLISTDVSISETRDAVLNCLLRSFVRRKHRSSIEK
jgi:thymidylate kinase